MKHISFIIPIYNAENFLYKNIYTLLQLMESLPNISCEYILINDGSKDNSMKELERINKPEIKIINKENEGIGSVFSIGITESSGELIVLIDLDLSYNISKIEEMIQLSEKWDCIVASKYLSPNNYPKLRTLFSFVYQKISKSILFLSVRDIGSGLVLVKSDYLKQIKIESKGFASHYEIFMKLEKLQTKTLEIPVEYSHQPGSFRFFSHISSIIKETFGIIANAK